MKLIIYLETLRYLRIIQVLYYVKNRIRGFFRKLIGHSYHLEVESKGSILRLKQWIHKYESYADGNFRFLNIESSVSDGINWNESKHGLLWGYNLNYMDFLLQERMNEAEGLRLIEDYINNLPGNEIGRSPYTISIRGVNWIKFLAFHRVSDTKINNSLYGQYLILIDNLEYHLCGNHLLENGLSLLFAAFFFRDQRFYAAASKILLKELNEQILSDGGHFEQSPMYQLILTDRMLDCLNLMECNEVFSNQGEIGKRLAKKISVMLGWIKTMMYTNGQIPLFNDSTYNIAPTAEQVLEYAGLLSVSPEEIKLGASGFRNHSSELYQIRMKMGEIKAGYIPGHSHADTFSFDMLHKNRPLIVDIGISTYEKNQRRLYERGTSAHNTVQVNHQDSSFVWSGFRVGRRAFVKHLVENEDSISATHTGYRRMNVFHERSYHFKSNEIEITDTLKGRKSVTGIARFHFHPDIDLHQESDHVFFEGGSLIFMGAVKITLSRYQFPLGYNLLTDSQLIEVNFQDKLISHITLN